MPNKEPVRRDSVGVWVKTFQRASQSAVEAALRPHGLGVTQWHVMYHLANDGPSTQRDLTEWLAVERATLSGVVASLVRKGLVEQLPDDNDGRVRLVRLTDLGRQRWAAVADPIEPISRIAFSGIDPGDLDTAVRVLRAATRQLEDHASKGSSS